VLQPPTRKEHEQAIDEMIAETRRLLRKYYLENGMTGAPPPGSITVRRSNNLVFHASPYLIEEEKKRADMEKRVIPPGVNFTDKPRISGLLRERYLDHLREACQHEYVGVLEMTARMDAMMIANTEDELKFLIHDLPALPEMKEEVKKKQPSYKSVAELVTYAAAVSVLSIVSPGQLFHLISTIVALILCGIAFSRWGVVRKSEKAREKNR